MTDLCVRRQAAVTVFAVVDDSISALCTEVRVWNIVETDADSLQEKLIQSCLGARGPLRRQFRSSASDDQHAVVANNTMSRLSPHLTEWQHVDQKC